MNIVKFKIRVFTTALILLLVCICQVSAKEFPFGVYDKYSQPNGSEEWFSYYEELARFLSENSINSVVLEALTPGSDPQVALKRLDIFHRKNIKVVQTIGNPLNKGWDKVGPKENFHRVFKHPSIIAYKYGDEPKTDKTLEVLKRQYTAIQKHYKAPVVTAIIGELLDGSEGFTESVWTQLDSNIKFARYYSLRREFDINDFNTDKTKMPFAKWCEYLEDVHESKPWWFIAQTFGRGIEKSHDSYWRLPTSAEMSAQLHIALANGARGIFGFALQPFGNPKNIFLIDNNFIPTRSRDNSIPLEAFSKVAKQVKDNQNFYLKHQSDSLKIESDNENVYVAVRYNPEVANEKYIYLVNMSADKAINSMINFDYEEDIKYANNLFNGTLREVTTRNDMYSLDIELDPGEGQIWKIKY